MYTVGYYNNSKQHNKDTLLAIIIKRYMNKCATYGYIKLDGYIQDIDWY